MMRATLSIEEEGARGLVTSVTHSTTPLPAAWVTAHHTTCCGLLIDPASEQHQEGTHSGQSLPGSLRRKPQAHERWASE